MLIAPNQINLDLLPSFFLSLYFILLEAMNILFVPSFHLQICMCRRAVWSAVFLILIIKKDKPSHTFQSFVINCWLLDGGRQVDGMKKMKNEEILCWCILTIRLVYPSKCWQLTWQGLINLKAVEINSASLYIYICVQIN